MDSGISGECLRTGVSLRCDDASRDLHVDAEVCRQMGLQSIAVVPLRGQIGRVGVLEAFSTEAYAFTEDKMALLERLAGLAEAAWARGAVTEPQAAGPGLVQPVEPKEAESQGETIDDAPTQVETSPEPLAPVAAEVPLAQVREVFRRSANQRCHRPEKVASGGHRRCSRNRVGAAVSLWLESVV